MSEPGRKKAELEEKLQSYAGTKVLEGDNLIVMGPIEDIRRQGGDV